MYELNQEVYHYTKGLCKVTEIHENFLGMMEYYVEFKDGTGLYSIDEELSKNPGKFHGRKECECGAWVTDFPDFHSDWCRLYKDPVI